MQNLKEKQDKEFEELDIISFTLAEGCRDVNGHISFKEFERVKKELRQFLDKVRKETAEAVCDKMIEQLDYNGLRENLGLKERKEAEEEIKKEIIENL